MARSGRLIRSGKRLKMVSPLDLRHGLTCVKHVTTASLWGIGRKQTVGAGRKH